MPDVARANARQGRAHALAIDTEGWVDLLWVGQWRHSDGPEAVNEADVRNVLGNLMAEANAAGPEWSGIPLYIGHPEVDDTLASAEARAWIKQFRINAAGRLQGLFEWCGNSRSDLIDSRAYKFLSCYEWGDFDDQGVFHPATISSVGLTNNPVKRDGQRPLANANATVGATGESPAHDQPGDTAMPDSPAAELDFIARANAVGADVAARITALIGDPANKEEAIDRIYQELRRVWNLEQELTAVETLVSKMANAANATLPEGDLQARCNALAEAVQAVCTERDQLVIDGAVGQGACEDTPTARANALRLLHADREAAKAHFANAKASVRVGHDPLAGLSPRRANAVEEPAGIRRDTQEVAGKITARANALMQAECKGNWDAAFSRATKEITTEGAAAGK